MDVELNFESLENDYKKWLVLEKLKIKKCKHNMLFEQLYNTDFIYILDEDQNRYKDGTYLRVDYINSLGIDVDYNVELLYSKPCNVLEMLISLVVRMDRDYVGDPENPNPAELFYQLLFNLNLLQYYDIVYSRDCEAAKNEVNKVLETWMWRRFNKDGEGSIFPLRRTFKNQKLNDIWSQMNEYLCENYPISTI